MTLAEEKLRELLELINITIDDIEVTEEEEGQLRLNLLSAEHGSIFIVRNREGMRALEQVLRTILFSINQDSPYIALDVNSYRANQEDQVCQMVAAAAERVLASSRSELLPPMEPDKRRVAHRYITEHYADRLTTSSENEGFDRRVRIMLPE